MNFTRTVEGGLLIMFRLLLKLQSVELVLFCLLVFTVDRVTGASNIEECQTEILVAVFGTLLFCFVVFGSVLAMCLFSKKNTMRNGGRKHNGSIPGHKLTDIEGRRNQVFEDDKDLDEYPSGGRKRQDSGFIASSNESIIPFPENYSSSAPRRSPSMPNLRVVAPNNEQNQQQMVNKDGSNAAKSQIHNHKEGTPFKKIEMVSIGVSTMDDYNMNHTLSPSSDSKASLENHQLPFTYQVKKHETVIIQKRSFNCTGIDFGIGGVFVKEFDKKDISFKKGQFSVGDEIISINDYPLRGLTDMEAFSFFAKSGPEVKLKIVRGVYLDKADGVSVTDFQLSETSSVDDEELANNTFTSSYLFGDGKMTSSDGGMISQSALRHSLNRLPRVIADANNMSFDGCDFDYQPSNFTTCSLGASKQNGLLLTAVNSNTSSSHSDSSSPNSPSRLQPTEMTTTNNKDTPPNGVTKSAIALESQEITKILLANPNLFMEFLASVQAKDKASRGGDNKQSCDNSYKATSECCAPHSRHSSCERQPRHSSHNSNEQSQQGAILDQQHPSCDTFSVGEPSSRQFHNNKNRFDLRANKSDDLGSPRMNHNNNTKNTLRSKSGDGGTQDIFTIDSYSSRSIEQQTYNDRQTTQQQQQQSQHLVLKRGYNTDYMVPMATQPPSLHNNNTTTSFTSPNSSIHRNNAENANVRRTSPGKMPFPLTVPRFQQPGTNQPAVITSIGSDLRTEPSSSPKTSVSSITSIPGGLLPRKPPPDYASLQRKTPSDLATGSEDESIATLNTASSPQRAPINIDADFRWKMNQKYCEPRMRKNPPPSYNASISSEMESVGVGGVTLRDKSSKASFNRSRPHSYTETGGGVLRDITWGGGAYKHRVMQPTSLSMDDDDLERRKHPKRTHSMPAVKQPELRPDAAQSFLLDDLQQQQQPQLQRPSTVNGDTTLGKYPPQYQQQLSLPVTIPSQQPPQYLQQIESANQLQQYLAQSVVPSPSYATHASVDTDNEELQNSATIDLTTDEATTHAADECEQATHKKLRTRQQRAADSFNRRKSIDSGTLRKLAEEMHDNPAFGGEYPILSQLLGETQFSASERRSQALYRYKSTEALYNQF